MKHNICSTNAVKYAYYTIALVKSVEHKHCIMIKKNLII